MASDIKPDMPPPYDSVVNYHPGTAMYGAATNNFPSAPPISQYSYPDAHFSSVYTIDQSDRMNLYPRAENETENLPTSVYGIDSPVESNNVIRTRKPATFIGLAIAALLFFLPCGICAVYHSYRSKLFISQ